jgi:hypothetical protein
MSVSLPRRDLILIPLLAIATVVVMMGAAEIGARATFVESGLETCGYSSGPLHWKPNCVSHRKTAEGPMVENAYNDCGYRTPTPCGTRSPGTIRVALMGTSTAQGFKVRYEDTFPAHLTATLSRACGRPVEFQNMGVAGASLLDVNRRVDEALAMRPDLIMLVVGPVELRAQLSRAEIAARDDPPSSAVSTPVKPPPGEPPPGEPPPGEPQSRSLVGRLSDLAYQSRALVVAQHFLFQDRATYIRLFMLHGEDADYLRPPMSPAWRQRLADFETVLSGMVGKARSHGVPLMLVWVPTRIQAALLAVETRNPGVDPYAVDRQIAEISTRVGASFVDTLDGFARQRMSEQYFYAVDGHLNGAGAPIFADTIQRRLIQGDIAPFAGC